jgi:hypothetical protein
MLSLATGRDVVHMWGYPLWLFLGVWIVLNARQLDRVTVGRIAFVWGVIFICTAAAYPVAYDLMQPFRPKYSAMLFPGDRLGAEMSRRYRAMTGQPLAYVIGGMWEGGNIAHYAPEHPRVLIDASPGRSPWIDLGDLRARGAIVIWPAGDPNVLPPSYRAIAEDAEIQPGFTLPMHRSGVTAAFGWAVLRPRPVVAGGPAN